MHASDTIVALASGAGRSGIAVVRVSGPDVRFITETIAGALPRPREAVLRTLVDSTSGLPIDRALVLFFSAPRSFTGEDVVEFQCHGSRAVVAALLDCLVNLSPSVRLAEPGEFARRAFLNGKMDLSAIEGLGDLIDSETEWQRRQAFRQMEGELADQVSLWRQQLLEAMALVEATLDFADEGDVDVDIAASVVPRALRLLSEMRATLRTAVFGERLREGFRLVITGAPNAGKSSLLNAIAKRDVAIVSPQPGTTRDVIELRCDIGGYPVIFSDTAGLRPTTDPVEQLGIDRARRALADGDLVLCLQAVDAPSSIVATDVPVLIVATKTDLGAPTFAHDLAVSTVTGAGIEHLLREIGQLIAGFGGGETALIANLRQRTALSQAIVALEGIAGAVGPVPELVAEDLRLCARALDQLVGRIDVEMVLDTLFARFCIGK